jgi:hypothetical protein
MNTRIVKAIVSTTCSRISRLLQSVIVARFNDDIYAQQFSNRLNGIGYVLVNEDKDILCVFDSEPTIGEIQYQLEESYSMELQVNELAPISLYNHYEVRGDNFTEIVEIVKTRLL